MMEVLDPDNDHVATKLLAFIRTALGRSSVGFTQPPIRLTGGYDTQVYRFSLSGVDSALSEPLVLRLYRGTEDGKKAIMEGTVQNALLDTGYPTAKVHFVCAAPSQFETPFIIMDYVPGHQLLAIGEPAASRLLGQTHARLHDIPPEFLQRRLVENGVADLRLEHRLKWLNVKSSDWTWLSGIAGWLLENRPLEPDLLSICHGDFHKLNLLVDSDDNVTGVVDWSNCSIMDPAYDVANTIIIFSIVSKHLVAEGEFPAANLEEVVEEYLYAYQNRRWLDSANLSYYKALRSAIMLVQASAGFEVWRHPLIVEDLSAIVQDASGIAISPPW